MNKQGYRWLTDAICHKQTLIQIYKCKYTVSWHRSQITPLANSFEKVKYSLALAWQKSPQCSARWTSSHREIKETELCFLWRVQFCTASWKSPLRWISELQIWHETYNFLRNSRDVAKETSTFHCLPCMYLISGNKVESELIKPSDRELSSQLCLEFITYTYKSATITWKWKC